MKTLSITMEETLVKDLDRGIHEANLAGRSEAIRQAVRDWLHKQKMWKKIQKEVAGYRKKPVKSDEFDSLMTTQEFPS